MGHFSAINLVLPGQLSATINSAFAQSKAIKKHTAARFGRALNPHLFRDCAASSIATEDPEHVRIIALILGHSTLKTAERYYITAGTRSATKSYQDLVRKLSEAR